MRTYYGLDEKLHGERLGNIFTNKLLLFFRELQGARVPVSISEMRDAINATTHIDIFNISHFYNALRASVVKEKEDLVVFDDVFRAFWRHDLPCNLHLPVDNKLHEGLIDHASQPIDSEEKLRKAEAYDEFKTDHVSLSMAPVQEQEDQIATTKAVKAVVYSPVEVLAKQDLSSLQANQLEEIERLMRKIIRRLSMTYGRRMRSNAKGVVDLRRTARVNMQYGGELLKLARKRRELRKAKLLVFCDVSGSMKSYSQFAVQCLYALHKIFHRIETFVFSTRLSRVTSYLRNNEFETGLQYVSQSVLDWGGGTKLGVCLNTLSEKYGYLLDRKTVVTIISDGWDTGDIELLEEQMQKLKQKTGKIIWLNPLLEEKDYEHICRGMQAALPYTDIFTSANTLKGLEDFISLLFRSRI